MTKKVSVAGAFARKEPYEYEGKQYEADLINNGNVKFLDEGTTVPGEYGEQTVFTIQTRNGAKNIALNQSSINILIDAFGDDSIGWVGQTVKTILKKDVVAGKKVIIAYLVTDEYVLDDFGDLVKEGVPEPRTDVRTPSKMPQEVIDAQNADVPDSPF